MVHWIYVLACDYGTTYVGETTKLFTRFNRHQRGTACSSTNEYPMNDVKAIYRLESLSKFLEKCTGEEYDNLRCENFITERLLIAHGDLRFSDDRLHQSLSFDISGKVRGGKYTKIGSVYTPVNNERLLTGYPMCYCGLPCDVRNGYTVNGDSDGTIAYFRCPKKNFWSDLVEKIEIIDEDPCNFYKEYGGEMDILRDLDIRVKPFGDIKVNDRGDVISDNKKYIQVPYRDKEIAKDLKCKWDSGRKSWFCQSDNIEALKRWKLNE